MDPERLSAGTLGRIKARYGARLMRDLGAHSLGVALVEVDGSRTPGLLVVAASPPPGGDGSDDTETATGSGVVSLETVVALRPSAGVHLVMLTDPDSGQALVVPLEIRREAQPTRELKARAPTTE